VRTDHLVDACNFFLLIDPMDNMTKAQRSRTMSRIRSVDTKPEQKLRSILHKHGYRFRKNVRELPGRPDVVLPKYNTIIFVNGCFWHQHPNCSKAAMPKSNKGYWEKKLKKNVYRDSQNIAQLSSSGWKVITVWECEIKEDCAKVAARIEENLHQSIN
jgi:DNA mismatch endonuclease (patch repair protein)